MNCGEWGGKGWEFQIKWLKKRLQTESDAQCAPERVARAEIQDR